jgi:hypothetical protein
LTSVQRVGNTNCTRAADRVSAHFLANGVAHSGHPDQLKPERKDCVVKIIAAYDKADPQNRLRRRMRRVRYPVLLMARTKQYGVDFALFSTSTCLKACQSHVAAYV